MQYPGSHVSQVVKDSQDFPKPMYLQLRMGTSLVEFYLFILQNKVRQFQIKLNYPEFQQLRNKPAKYTLCVVVFR